MTDVSPVDAQTPLREALIFLNALLCVIGRSAVSAAAA
jgi:hypothetical protein